MLFIGDAAIVLLLETTNMAKHTNNAANEAANEAAAVEAAALAALATLCMSTAPVAAKAATKKQRVIDMLRSENGATVAQIATELQIGKVAARSLIGDVRHAKIAVAQANGVYKLA